MFGMCNSCHRLQSGDLPSDTIKVNIIPLASTDCCAEPEQRLQFSQHVVGEEVRADDIRIRPSPERPTLLTHEAGMKTSAAHRKVNSRGQPQWSAEEVLSRTVPPPPPVPRPPRVPPQPPEQLPCEQEEQSPQHSREKANCDELPVDEEEVPAAPPRESEPRQSRSLPREQVQLAQQTSNPLQRSRSIRERTDELEDVAADLLSCNPETEAEDYQLVDDGDAGLDQQQPVLATLYGCSSQSGRRSSRALLGEFYRPPALEPLDEVSSEMERGSEADTMRSGVACGSRTFARPTEDRCPALSSSPPAAAEAARQGGDLATGGPPAAATTPAERHPSSAQGEGAAKHLPPKCHHADDPGEPTLLDAPVVKLRPSCFRIACRCVFGGRR